MHPDKKQTSIWYKIGPMHSQYLHNFKTNDQCVSRLILYYIYSAKILERKLVETNHRGDREVDYNKPYPHPHSGAWLWIPGKRAWWQKSISTILVIYYPFLYKKIKYFLFFEKFCCFVSLLKLIRKIYDNYCQIPIANILWNETFWKGLVWLYS